MGWRWYVNNLSGLIRSCCPWIECLKHYAGKSLWKVSFAEKQIVRLFCTFSKHSAKCVSQVFILGSLLGRRIAFQISLMYCSIDGNLFLRTPFVLSLHSLLVLLGTLLQFHICLSLSSISVFELENIFFVKIFEGKVVTKIKRNTTTFCWVHFARIHIKYAVSLTSLKMKEKFVNKSKAFFSTIK